MSIDRIPVLYGISQLTIGGAERQLYELACHLDQTLFRPLVFTTLEGGAYADLLRQAGIPLYVFPRKFPFDIRPVLRIAKLMQREQVQILHTYGYYGGLFGRLATYFYRPRIVISSERATKARDKFLQNPIYFNVDKHLARRTDCFIANAHAVKKFAVDEKKLPADKMQVIYNGVDEERFTAVSSQQRQQLKEQYDLGEGINTVGIVARLDSMKDHHTFIQAIALVMENWSKAKFFIIGEGPLDEELKSYSKDLKLQQAIIFTGAKKGSELINMVSLLDIVVLSSKEGEGCSNAILEAMALGKPVIATDVGGNAELVIDQESGIIIPPENPKALASAMIDLLKNQHEREKMGNNAKSRIEDLFSVDRMVNDTKTLYEKLSN